MISGTEGLGLVSAQDLPFGVWWRSLADGEDCQVRGWLVDAGDKAADRGGFAEGHGFAGEDFVEGEA